MQCAPTILRYLSPMPNTEDNTAHHKAKLGPGVLLAARDVLEDPNFSNTIVLLCQHGSEGAYGLVLNRPSHMPLREIFEHPPEGDFAPRRVYIGGPVQPTELQILQIAAAGNAEENPEEKAMEAMEIAPGVYMGGRWDTLEQILTPDPRRVRLFLGYAGWGGGQLEEEVEAGAWEVWPADIRRLLEEPEEAWAAGLEQLRRFLASQ
jgi:putative transcriptional regulator